MTPTGYRAVFFDAGETLVHPHPTFADLFAQTLRTQGYDVSPETVRERGHVVFDRFRSAARANWSAASSRCPASQADRPARTRAASSGPYFEDSEAASRSMRLRARQPVTREASMACASCRRSPASAVSPRATASWRAMRSVSICTQSSSSETTSRPRR